MCRPIAIYMIYNIANRSTKLLLFKFWPLNYIKILNLVLNKSLIIMADFVAQFVNRLNKKNQLTSAMTRIRTWVSSATTRGTDHYTIMAIVTAV